MNDINKMIKDARQRFEHLFFRKINGEHLPPNQFNELRRLYHQQPEWHILREKIRHRCGNICEHCNNAPYEDCHHIHYRNYFKEKIEDLMGVCKPCHKYLTLISKNGKSCKERRVLKMNDKSVNQTDSKKKNYSFEQLDEIKFNYVKEIEKISNLIGEMVDGKIVTDDFTRIDSLVDIFGKNQFLQLIRSIKCPTRCAYNPVSDGILFLSLLKYFPNIKFRFDVLKDYRCKNDIRSFTRESGVKTKTTETIDKLEISQRFADMVFSVAKSEFFNKEDVESGFVTTLKFCELIEIKDDEKCYIKNSLWDLAKCDMNEISNFYKFWSCTKNWQFNDIAYEDRENLIKEVQQDKKIGSIDRYLYDQKGCVLMKFRHRHPNWIKLKQMIQPKSINDPEPSKIIDKNNITTLKIPPRILSRITQLNVKGIMSDDDIKKNYIICKKNSYDEDETLEYFKCFV